MLICSVELRLFIEKMNIEVIFFLLVFVLLCKMENKFDVFVGKNS